MRRHLTPWKTPIFPGKAIAADVRAEIAEEVKTLGIQPGLAVVLVGNRPDSATYVRYGGLKFHMNLFLSALSIRDTAENSDISNRVNSFTFPPLLSFPRFLLYD